MVQVQSHGVSKEGTVIYRVKNQERFHVEVTMDRTLNDWGKMGCILDGGIKTHMDTSPKL